MQKRLDNRIDLCYTLITVREELTEQKEETKMKNAMVKVNNVPAYAESLRFWVVRLVDGALWFWGAWSDEQGAQNAAREIGGLMVTNE